MRSSHPLCYVCGDARPALLGLFDEDPERAPRREPVCVPCWRYAHGEQPFPAAGVSRYRHGGEWKSMRMPRRPFRLRLLRQLVLRTNLAAWMEEVGGGE